MTSSTLVIDAETPAASKDRPYVGPRAFKAGDDEEFFFGRDNEVLSHGEAVKHIRHPVLGPIAFEYSAFAVDGRPDLSLLIYNPASPADAEKIASMVGSAPGEGERPLSASSARELAEQGLGVA